MNIGIVGTGLIGGNLARLFTQAGHSVLLSFSRSPSNLAGLAAQIGANAHVGTPAEAVQFGEVVVLSAHFAAMDIAIAQMENVKGKIVIDTSNAFDILLPPGISAAKEVLRRLPGVRLVKAFNTLMYSDLLDKSYHQPLYAMPYSGDDEAANKTVAGLITSIGYAPIYTGDLSHVALQEMGGPLYGKPLAADEAQFIVNQALA